MPGSSSAACSRNYWADQSASSNGGQGRSEDAAGRCLDLRSVNLSCALYTRQSWTQLTNDDKQCASVTGIAARIRTTRSLPPSQGPAVPDFDFVPKTPTSAATRPVKKAQEAARARGAVRESVTNEDLCDRAGVRRARDSCGRLTPAPFDDKKESPHRRRQGVSVHKPALLAADRTSRVPMAR